MIAFRNLHAGETCAILANGSSILEHDLSRVRCKTLGVNRAWELLWPTYHLTLERAHYDADPAVYDRLASEGRLFHMGALPVGHVIPNAAPFPGAKRARFWSDDLTVGAVSQVGTVGSVAYVALQLAAYLGFAVVYFLGLDLGGEHFHGCWPASPEIARQNVLFQHAAHALRDRVAVWNVGSPDTRDRVWPRISFEEAFA